MSKYDDIREMQDLTLTLLNEHLRPLAGDFSNERSSRPNLKNFAFKVQPNLNKIPTLMAKGLQERIQLLKDFYKKIGTPKFVFHTLEDNVFFNRERLQEYEYKAIVKSSDKEDLEVVFDDDTTPEYRRDILQHILDILYK